MTGLSIEDFIQMRLTEEIEVLDSALALRRIGASQHQTLVGFIHTFQKILDWHENWPVLVETVPSFELGPMSANALNEVTVSLTKQMKWMTEKMYIETFGEAPPSAPILRILAHNWRRHADYQDEWKINES